jgi:hypothetical protein
MTSVNCETLTPPGLEVVEGRRVYRSNHIVTVLNDTGENILYDVEAIMFDSLGHSNSSSALNVVAPGGSNISSGVYFVELDANLYESGVQVEFTCETHITGGLSAVDRKVDSLITT